MDPKANMHASLLSTVQMRPICWFNTDRATTPVLTKSYQVFVIGTVTYTHETCYCDSNFICLRINLETKGNKPFLVRHVRSWNSIPLESRQIESSYGFRK